MRDFFSLVLLILKKDFVIETREKLNLSYLIILCPTITLIISIFVQSQAIFMEYFLSILIITLLVNQRISRQEISTGGEIILIGAPFDLSILCFSKIICRVGVRMRRRFWNIWISVVLPTNWSRNSGLVMLLIVRWICWNIC